MNFKFTCFLYKLFFCLFFYDYIGKGFYVRIHGIYLLLITFCTELYHAYYLIFLHYCIGFHSPIFCASLLTFTLFYYYLSLVYLYRVPFIFLSILSLFSRLLIVVKNTVINIQWLELFISYINILIRK